jgi:hypothetical protein
MEVLTQFSESEAEEEVGTMATNCVTPQRPRMGVGMGSEEDGGTDVDVEYVFEVNADGSPSKRRKVDKIEAVSSNFDVHLFSEALQGGIEILYCEKFNRDSASQLTRIRSMLGEKDPKLIQLGVRAVAERADKHSNGEPVVVTNLDTYEGRVYNKLVLIRMVESTSKKSRREALGRLANMMNLQTRELIKEKELKANQPQWRVRRTFDRTPADPKNFRKLDEVVSPVFALKIITEAYTGVGPSWGLDNPRLASMFFSPPYSKLIRDSIFRGQQGRVEVAR